VSDPTALHAANGAYIEQLYSQFLDSPTSVSESWRTFFADYEDGNGLSSADVGAPPPTRRSIFGGRVAADVAERAVHTHKNAVVLELISNYRRNGHLVADLDPLGLKRSRSLPQLHLAYHGLGEDDLDSVFHTGRFGGPMTLRDIIRRCEAIYTGSIGAEFQYIRDVKRRRWLEHRIEEPGGDIRLDRAGALRVLDKMVAADHFENFIHTKYLGAKRFSVEGAEAVIPLLDTLIDTAASLGVQEVMLGMAHRGRLNVLVNILGKAHSDIFEEFEDSFERPAHLGSGDVKYHLGYSADIETHSGARCHVALAFNPSHLEFVAPVVEGQIRGKQDHFQDVRRQRAMSIIIHGDAAIAGQGITAETINLGRLPGYDNGGTIHLVINNQIGFTTPPELSRSSEHCTDIVKVILLPVLHVNADDLGAVAYVARLAAEYRQEFGQDIVIDLVCYRKYGHNEGDEPLFTNPVMYHAVRARQSPLDVFVERHLTAGVLSEEDVADAKTRIREHLESELSRARDKDRQHELLGGLWKGLHTSFDPAAVDWPTKVPADKLVPLGEAICRAPPDFALNRKLGRILGRRQAMLRGEAPLDWAMAEGLAFATLLAENHPVRLTGQDTGRGTFSHRHAVLHDQVTGEIVVPLTRLGVKQAQFDVIDSPLSEAAVLGFEFGYTLVRPNMLVVWEAQFGDFANGAQVLIDQFVCSSEAKWNRASGLVMLLPHGYEGQGPEHSSARIERFLQLSGEDNWRLVNPTLPSQLFHVLRSQLHRNYRKPLIVFTPKSLLRHAQCVSPLSEFTEGGWQPLIGDTTVEAPKRIVMCSGKVYYDLIKNRSDPVAVVRLEQLYPFREDVAKEVLAPLLETATELVWCQEEPINMGAWSFVEPILRELTPLSVRYVGRSRAASPATGSKHLHIEEQSALVRQAMELS
jgi:2-oxoglutarate dehydrogenase E1 component